MCYPKPGPRCSAHAKERYILLRHKQRALMKKPGYSFDEYLAIQDEIDAAELDYDSTPVGQARLELRLKQETDYNGEIAERLAKVKELRRLQLAAVKAQDDGDIYNHGDATTWNSGDLLPPRKHRKNWKASRTGAKLVNDYIAFAKNFAQKLSTAEANALYWHTSDGSGVLNDIIHKKENQKSNKWTYENLIKRSGAGRKYPQAMIKNQIKTLDGIFAKHPLQEPIVVYRGIGMNNLPDEITSISDPAIVSEYLQDKYPVGETIEIPEYMSTSADPAIGHKFAGLGLSVVLEIKTKRAVPVGMVSAWDVDEREFVVNRNGKYKVLGVHQKVTYEDVYVKSRATGPHNKNVTVIQLEEV
jgi:hypothetical protein